MSNALKTIYRAGVMTLAIAILAACGGGGNSTSSTANPSSYWMMDSFQYDNGGHSATTVNEANGVAVTTAAISTATISGGDKSNGAYSGSALTFAFKGAPVSGVYTVVPNRAAFVAADVSSAPIMVDVSVGVATTTGSTVYTASSGQVHVTRDGSGAYHFTSVAAMPAAKTMDLQGGVAGAPATMTLTIVDAM